MSGVCATQVPVDAQRRPDDRGHRYGENRGPRSATCWWRPGPILPARELSARRDRPFEGAMRHLSGAHRADPSQFLRQTDEIPRAADPLEPPPVRCRSSTKTTTSGRASSARTATGRTTGVADRATRGGSCSRRCQFPCPLQRGKVTTRRRPRAHPHAAGEPTRGVAAGHVADSALGLQRRNRCRRSRSRTASPTANALRTRERWWSDANPVSRLEQRAELG